MIRIRSFVFLSAMLISMVSYSAELSNLTTFLYQINSDTNRINPYGIQPWYTSNREFIYDGFTAALGQRVYKQAKGGSATPVTVKIDSIPGLGQQGYGWLAASPNGKFIY